MGLGENQKDLYACPFGAGASYNLHLLFTCYFMKLAAPPLSSTSQHLILTPPPCYSREELWLSLPIFFRPSYISLNIYQGAFILLLPYQKASCWARLSSSSIPIIALLQSETVTAMQTSQTGNLFRREHGRLSGLFPPHPNPALQAGRGM